MVQIGRVMAHAGHSPARRSYQFHFFLEGSGDFRCSSRVALQCNDLTSKLSSQSEDLVVEGHVRVHRTLTQQSSLQILLSR